MYWRKEMNIMNKLIWIFANFVIWINYIGIKIVEQSTSFVSRIFPAVLRGTLIVSIKIMQFFNESSQTKESKIIDEITIFWRLPMKHQSMNRIKESIQILAFKILIFFCTILYSSNKQLLGGFFCKKLLEFLRTAKKNHR